MKTTAIYRTDYASRPNLPFPNAATRKDIVHKILDLLLMAALGMGTAAILLFLLALT
jgi:ABC-type phosphate/phosphonate transport system permease subunit